MNNARLVGVVLSFLVVAAAVVGGTVGAHGPAWVRPAAIAVAVALAVGGGIAYALSR